MMMMYAWEWLSSIDSFRFVGCIGSIGSCRFERKAKDKFLWEAWRLRETSLLRKLRGFLFSVPTLLFLEKTVGKVKWVVRLPLRGDPLYFSDGRTTHFTLAWRIPLLSVDNALFISYWAWALPSRPNYISIGDFYLSIHVLGRRCCCLIAVFCFNFLLNWQINVMLSTHQLLMLPMMYTIHYNTRTYFLFNPHHSH